MQKLWSLRNKAAVCCDAGLSWWIQRAAASRPTEPLRHPSVMLVVSATVYHVACERREPQDSGGEQRLQRFGKWNDPKTKKK